MNDYKKNKKIYLQSRKSNKTILLFKADWCIFCKKFDHTWKELQSSNKLKDVVFKTYDSEKEKQYFTKYNIESFPTIIFKNNNTLQKYEGDRNVKDLTHFILSS